MAEDHKITGVTQETQLASSGSGFRPVFKANYEVTAGPAKGTTGHVIIPASEYDKETVAKAVKTMVDKHHEVHKI